MWRALASVGLAAALGCQAPAPPASGGRDLRLHEAEVALLAERWGDAEARYREVAAAAADPARVAACWYWIGVCRRGGGDATGAREAFAAVLGAGDANVQAWARLALGDLGWEAGDWAAAREMYATVDPAALVADDARRRARRVVGAAARAGDWDAATAALPALAAAGADADEVAALALAAERRCYLVIAGEFPGPRREADAPSEAGPPRLPPSGHWPPLTVPEGDRWTVVGFAPALVDATDRLAKARAAGLAAVIVP